MSKQDRDLRDGVLRAVIYERERQFTLGYCDNHDTLSPDRWLGVLAREFCEAGNEANECFKGRAANESKLRAELVQVAAVAVAWAEAIDRRGGTQP